MRWSNRLQIGEPDFGGGAAEEQYLSVRKLMQLPDWMAVFPGHFEGPCGNGMCGRPSTTIGFERRFNRTAGLEHEAFVQTVAEQIPARPLNMLAIEATNKGLTDAPWAALTSAPPVAEVDVQSVAERSPRTFLLDVREPGEYAAGHVPGAVNIPQAEMATRLGEITKDRPLMVICQGEARSLRVAQFLKQVGYDQVVSIAGGTNAWQVSGRPLTVDGADSSVKPGATPPIVADSAWTHAGMQ